MILSFKFSIFLFPSLLWIICNSSSAADTCYTKIPPENLKKLNAKAIIKDVNSFSNNFKKRYNALKKFTRDHMSQVDKQDVQFYLYTKDNKNKPDHLDQRNLKKSHFITKYPIKVLVHGLQPLKAKDHGTEAIKHALLAKNTYNVIVMKYPKVAAMPYTKALNYHFLVAIKAADFLHHLLKTFKLKPDSLHLIGFEFGGQLVGNIGDRIPGLARITALDPAGALFERFDDEHSLDPNDADFVDVIHTSIKKFPAGLGLAKAVGHEDFYPNGGKDQPGCPHNITAKQAGGKGPAAFKNAICDNVRSIELFVESICTDLCFFVGTACKNYKEYETGVCEPFLNPTLVMGFTAEKHPILPARTKFYLKTKSKYQYCDLSFL